jgi:dual-specificity kinase
MIEAVCDSKITPHLVQKVNKMSAKNGPNSAAKYVSPGPPLPFGGTTGIDVNLAGFRYFKRQKLDYPTTETTRASRRFVKNMKKLSVCQITQGPTSRSARD